MGRTSADPLIGAAAGPGSGRRDAAQIGQSGAYERCGEPVGLLDRCSSALRTRSRRAACACDPWAQPTPTPWSPTASAPRCA